MTAGLILLLTAYVAIVALLLALNLRSPWRRRVKLGAVILAVGFYLIAFEGHKRLLGWATPAPMPEQFRLHWIRVDEPDKPEGASGAIFFWISEIDEAGLPIGEPRAHRLPWNLATAQAAQKALATLAEGEPLNGRLTRTAAAAKTEAGEPTPSGASAPNPANGSLQPQFEFRRAPLPELPAKPPMGENERKISRISGPEDAPDELLL